MGQSVLHLLRVFLARTLVHPLEGVVFGDWVRILRREGFRVAVRWWPRALWITGLSLGNSVAAGVAHRRFGARVASARVERPVFILGHYRSGTTYLHELLAMDPRFASPDRFQTFNPRAFLATESWLKPLVEPFMLPRRVQEDEVALMVLTGLSPYMDWCFPRGRAGYGRYSTLRDATAGEVAEWSRALDFFLRSLTVRHGRPILLKSPPHTGRIRPILDVYPDARFVHIRRDPFAVYASTLGLLRALPPVFGLQARRSTDVDAVIRTYAEMYDAYFADRDLVPPGQLVEVAYEDLERDPIGQVRSVYEGLDLGDFGPARPALETYLASIAGYRKNRNPEIDGATRARLAGAWSRCFDAWGYPR